MECDEMSRNDKNKQVDRKCSLSKVILSIQNSDGRLSSREGNTKPLSRSSSLLDGLDDGLVGDEDAVQELTLVLGADLAALGDLGAAERQSLLVNALEDDLVLDLGAEAGLAAWLEHDSLDVATTQEVLELDPGAVLGNGGVDGEMSVDESHLVEDTLKPHMSLLLIKITR